MTGEAVLDFEGIGFAVTGSVEKTGEAEYVFKVEVSVDGKPVEIVSLPTQLRQRRESLFWRYRLPAGSHHVVFKVLNPTDSAVIEMEHALIYGDKPIRPEF